VKVSAFTPAWIPVNLGRSDEAQATIRDALDPDSQHAWTQANQGWIDLDKCKS